MAAASGSVSVVVCCRDRARLLAGALTAISAALRPGDELIVVDSASRESDVAVVAEASGARVLRAGRRGASIARNLGWRAAQHEIVAFTDDDCRPGGFWLAEVGAAFADDSVGFAYGSVTSAGDGPPLSIVGGGAARWAPGDVRAIDGFGHGANLTVRRAALLDVGGWDPRLGAGTRLRGGEDADLALRLLRAGWAGVFVPAAAVAHLSWRGRRAALATVWGYGLGAGAVAVKAGGADGDRWLLRHELGTRGVRPIAADLRGGYQFGVAAGVLRTVGVIAGATIQSAGQTRVSPRVTKSTE